jgi:hypothetical protein
VGRPAAGPASARRELCHADRERPARLHGGLMEQALYADVKHTAREAMTRACR